MKKKNKILENKERLISKENSKVKVLVIPTNEELQIAKETVEVFRKQQIIT